MRRKKKKVLTRPVLYMGALLLALASSMPVNAAPGDLKFNLVEYTNSVKKLLPQRVVELPTPTPEAGKGSLIANYPTKTPGDFGGAKEFLDLQIDTNNVVYMPFYNPHTSVYDTVHMKLNGKSWEDLGLNGYTLNGWFTRADGGILTNRLDGSQNFPTSDSSSTYYLKLGADPNVRFKQTVTHASSDADVFIPGMESVEKRTPVLQTFSINPKNIPGYKVVARPNVSFDNSVGNRAIGIDNTDFDINPNSKVVKGTTINRDFEVQYQYAIDTNQKFTLTVEDALLDRKISDGGSVQTKTTRESYSLNVLDVVDAKNIQPNTVYSGQHPSRYLLDSVTITYFAGTPNSNGQFPIGNLLPAKDVMDGNSPNILFDALDVADGNAIKGKMLNQNVTITYNYYPNPDFYTVIRVKYEDNFGDDITKKLYGKIENLKSEDDASLTIGEFYKERYEDKDYVSVRMVNGTNVKIPAPVLTTYFTDPKAEVNNILHWQRSYDVDDLTSLAWSESEPSFSVSATNPRDNVVFRVIYDKNINSETIFNLSSTEGGALKVGSEEYNPSANRDHIVAIPRTEQTQDSYKLDFAEQDLPSMAANAGYEGDGWTYKDTWSQATSVFKPLLFSADSEITDIPTRVSQIELQAKFKKKDGEWNTYRIQSEGANIRIPGDTEMSVVNVENDGTQRSIRFSELQAITSGISIASGYRALWKDGNGATVDDNTDITGLDNTTFTVYAVPMNSEEEYKPNVTPGLDAVSGIPYLLVDKIQPNPIDARLQYVVEDVQGVVLEVLSGAELIRKQGKISGDFLTPGDTYRVRTARFDVPIIRGGMAPSVDVSDFAQITIPAALQPVVTEDIQYPGKTSITIRPVSPNTEYALVDADGTEIYPFLTPTGNAYTFQNLEPGKTYQVIAKPGTSNETISDRLAKGATVEVPTDRFGTLLTTFDVLIQANQNENLSGFRVKIDSEHFSEDVSKLRNLRPGTSVVIEASALNANSVAFSQWNVSIPNIQANINTPLRRISFTMPNQEVKLQVLYSDVDVNWTVVYEPNIPQSQQNIGIVFPNVTEPGNYRALVRTYDAQNAYMAELITRVRNEIHPTFKGLFMFMVELQKQNPLTGEWEEYTDTNALQTSISTGALLSTRDYKLFEVTASPSNAIMDRTADMNLPSDIGQYTGAFDTMIQNKEYRYVFGYTVLQTFRIVLKDTTDSNWEEVISIQELETLQDYESRYAHRIRNNPYVDEEGVTWSYEGLSTNRNAFEEYNPQFAVRENAVVYLYYSNDKKERAKALKDLQTLMTSQRNGRDQYTANSKERLQAKLQDIQDRLNGLQKPNTDTILSYLQELEEFIKTLEKVRPSIDSGKNSGSQAGGGGGRNSLTTKIKTINQKSGIVVGLDGDWELVDKESHIWMFRFKDGKYAIGWNQLSYVYEGKTKIDWYYFDENGIMLDGWFKDVDGSWYYLSEEHDGFFGHMILGWHKDIQDGRWYYLDPKTGVMHTGWDQIDGVWYYLNPIAPAQTYFYSSVQKKWLYNEEVVTRPYGSMYQGEITPDGFHVNASGAWVK